MISLTEYILQDLYYKMPLYEQALSRNKLFDKISNNISMILSHWGLLEYTTNSEYNAPQKYKDSINHWKRELVNFCGQIANQKIKGGKREKAIEYCLINTHEINDFDQVYDYIKDKFYEEDIDMLTTKKIAKYLSDNYMELVNEINNKTYLEWIRNF